MAEVSAYATVPTIRDILGVKSSPKKELDGISVYPVLKGDRDYMPRDMYLGCGTIVNRDYKLIFPGKNSNMKAVTEDFLISFKEDLFRHRSLIHSRLPAVRHIPARVFSAAPALRMGILTVFLFIGKDSSLRTNGK
jgi:hypothetical protein